MVGPFCQFSCNRCPCQGAAAPPTIPVGASLAALASSAPAVPAVPAAPTAAAAQQAHQVPTSGTGAAGGVLVEGLEQLGNLLSPVVADVPTSQPPSLPAVQPVAPGTPLPQASTASGPQAAGLPAALQQQQQQEQEQVQCRTDVRGYLGCGACFASAPCTAAAAGLSARCSSAHRPAVCCSRI